MKGTNKFFAGVLLGAVAGAAIAVFLKSEKGQELLAKVKKGAEDLGDNVKTKWEAFEEEISASLQKEEGAMAGMETNNEVSS